MSEQQFVDLGQWVCLLLLSVWALCQGRETMTPEERKAKRPPRLSALVRRMRRGDTHPIDRLIAKHDETGCTCFTVRDDKGGSPSVQYIGCPVHWKEGGF